MDKQLFFIIIFILIKIFLGFETMATILLLVMTIKLLKIK